MTSSVLSRVLRQPFIWLGIAVLIVFAVLFALESTGGKSAPHVIPFSMTGNNGHASNGNGANVGGGHDNNNDGLPDHCTDGHGQDGVHNPHCRPASGGQP